MRNTQSSVKCKHCGHKFHPNMQGVEGWLCPNCQTKHPNLRRHYRAIAYLCGLGCLVTLIVLLQGFGQEIATVMLVGNTMMAILFAVTTGVVYRAQAPWNDAGIRSLIWTVFGLAVILSVVVPLSLSGTLNMSPIIVFALVFPYLFWVDGHARRSSA